MQAGVDKWEVAGFLAITVELLDRMYGHHHPQHLRQAAKAIGYRPKNEKLVGSLVDSRSHHTALAQPVENVGVPGRTRTCNQTVMSEPISKDDRDKSIS